MKTWLLENLEALLVLGIGLGASALVLIFLLWRALRRQHEMLELLDVRFGTLQEHAQHEALTMGQRIIDAEKQVRRFSDRVEALEHSSPSAEHYGQLGSLLAGKLTPPESHAESAAELQLKSLLQRGKPQA